MLKKENHTKGQLIQMRGSAEKAKKALDLYEQGKSYDEIGDVLGLKSKTARDYVSRAKRERKCVIKRPESRIDTGMMMALFKAGWAIEDVAIEFGVNTSDVAKSFIKVNGMALSDWKRRNQYVC